MIARVLTQVRRANREQRKLLFSLSASFMTRFPGAVGLVWFLPLLRFGLGTDDYANMLAAMALAGVAAFFANASSFNLMGRRTIGEAYANGDCAAEADALASAFVANLLAVALSIATVAVFCWQQGESHGSSSRGCFDDSRGFLHYAV